MKDVIWHGDARDVIKQFPRQVRIDIGTELTLLQLDETPLHTRPMRTVGTGVWEIRVRFRNNHYRVFYVVKRDEGIHVLHAFKKASRETPKTDIELGKQRLTEV